MIKDKNLRVLDYIDGKEILIQMGEEGSELYFDDDAEKIWSFTVEADKIADEKRKRWIKRLKERNQF